MDRWIIADMTSGDIKVIIAEKTLLYTCPTIDGLLPAHTLYLPKILALELCNCFNRMEIMTSNWEVMTAQEFEAMKR